MVKDLSTIGFGCVALSSLPTAGAAQRVLELVYDLGVTHFDTAPIYGQGLSEVLLGRFLRGRRDRVTVATKFGLGSARARLPPPWLALPMNYCHKRLTARRRLEPRTHDDVAGRPPLVQRRITRAQVQASFDQSRRALHTDYFDVYLLHEGLPSFLDVDALDYLLELKRSGLVRRIGLAAGGWNYAGLTADTLAAWDVLQYEFGPAWPETRALPTLYPEHIHIFHSCLRGVAERSAARLGDPDSPGRVLAECAAAAGGGHVLFSSTRAEHIRRNLHTYSVASSVGAHAVH